MNWQFIRDNLPDTEDVVVAIANLMLKPNFDYDTVVEAADTIQDDNLKNKFIEVVLDELEHGTHDNNDVLQEYLLELVSDSNTVFTTGEPIEYLRKSEDKQ
ncbi:hypothetical protein [Nostoc sp. 106C]|uniref:hypothetical protein n=1 Tax=Nostoc sp. 106C TaxID=1932667 RepID=UPI000A3BA126|nr:hypothetical protein [Nostoc sp. 106C]OUL17830.1 hypothetical protein BV375_34925 [Nostoc sp. 106C]